MSINESGLRHRNSWYNETMEQNYHHIARTILAVGGVITAIAIASPIVTGMFGGSAVASSSIGSSTLSQFSGIVTSVSALFTTTFFRNDRNDKDVQSKEKNDKKKEDKGKK